MTYLNSAAAGKQVEAFSAAVAGNLSVLLKLSSFASRRRADDLAEGLHQQIGMRRPHRQILPPPSGRRKNDI
jgi:hypothetical protein